MARYDYDLAIIGGGTAGLLASTTAKLMGAKAVLIEGERIGGDCTWTGCVPSKTLIASAKAAHAARHSASYGIHTDGVRVDFAAVMQRVRDTVHHIYADESPDVLRADGIEVIEAYARFTDPHTLALSDGKTLTARSFILATGASPIVPPAFASVPHLTNRTLFDLTTQPRHLIILGGGPIGCEMAQAFTRLGTTVTLIDQAPRLLLRDDAESAALVMESLQSEGVTVKLGVKATSATGTPGDITLTLENGETIHGDALLLALGRRPNVQKMELELAGVELDTSGKLITQPTLQTSAPHIYAAGDVVGGHQFTHVAGYHGYITARNALLPLFKSKDSRPVPWATFTDPEVAHVGLTEVEAIEHCGAGGVQITRLPMTRSDRAQTEGKPGGFLKAVHQPNGKLLGVTIVGLNAGDMITEWASLMWRGGKITDASSFVRPYPNHAVVNGTLGLSFTRKNLPNSLAGRLLRGLVRAFNR
ncbi:MAG: FAD-dependent oxidoreductase [Anaerolineae bacterium]|nr:FAD-dependent oxidoreductase [Anaerolineae bacterium]